MIIKYYPDSSIFVILFNDGTGTVYYPSGRVAISVSATGELRTLAVYVVELFLAQCWSSAEPGKFTYIVQDDSDESNVRGVFDPYGVASTYYSSGKLR